MDPGVEYRYIGMLTVCCLLCLQYRFVLGFSIAILYVAHVRERWSLGRSIPILHFCTHLQHSTEEQIQYALPV